MNAIRFAEIVEKTNLVFDVNSIEKLCEEIASELNFSFYFFSVVETTSLCSPNIKIHSNFPERWLTTMKEALLCSDPLMGCFVEKRAPQKWSLASSSEGNAGEIASEATLIGVSIPIRAVTGETVSFALAVQEASGLGFDVDEVIPYAHTFAAHLFDQYAKVVSNDEGGRKRLTQREKDCLFWACEGKTTWEISKIMDISERTVVFHLKNSEGKLCAKSRQHAVALATMRGLIRPIVSFGKAVR